MEVILKTVMMILKGTSSVRVRERDKRDAEVGEGVSSEANIGENLEVGGCSSDSEVSEAASV